MLSFLYGQRRHVLGILDGLDTDALRQPVLPSGWNCLGMVQCLAPTSGGSSSRPGNRQQVSGPYYPRVTSPLISTRRRRLAAFSAVAALCAFAWWAVQPVGGACADTGLTLSSDPYGSTYDSPDAVKGSGDVQYEGKYVPSEGSLPSADSGSSLFGSGSNDPCGAETQHPRLFGWLGL
nr:DinB family protein [Streptomyces sp. SID14478]